MLRQHEEGPAHKKAVAREKAEREREAWATNPSAAANALVYFATNSNKLRQSISPFLL